jgi:hypothetical protein
LSPVGGAQIVLVITPGRREPANKLGDLLNSEFFGMWRDKAEIDDSAAFARQLGDESWKRRG